MQQEAAVNKAPPQSNIPANTTTSTISDNSNNQQKVNRARAQIKSNSSFSPIASSHSSPMSNNSSSMALLSPPSSRYAFEPALTTAAIPPISSVLMEDADSALSAKSILSSPKNATAVGAGAPAHDYSASASSVPPLRERKPALSDGIPAFQPNTGAKLQTFSMDLASFSRWISDMKPDQQKTVADVFLSAASPLVVSYIHERSAGGSGAVSDALSFSSPISNCAVPAPERPISPLVMLNGDSISQASARMSANAPLFSSAARTRNPGAAGPSHAAQGGTAAPVASVPVVSPALGSPILGMSSDPVARPRSAGPLSYIAGDGSMDTRQAAYLGGQSQLQAPAPSAIGAYGANSALSAQPLFRVFSSDLDNSGYQHRARDFFSDDLQRGMRLPALANQLEMSKTQFQPDGAHSAAAAQQFGLTSATDFAGQNALKLNQSLSTMARKPQHAQQPHAHHAHHAGKPGAESSATSAGAGSAGSASLPQSSGAAAANQRGRAHSAMRGIRSAGSSAPPSRQTSRNVSGHVSGSISPPSVVKSASPEDIASRNLLVDIPLWLKTLRLHKYTDNLKDLKWQDMINLDDQQLEKLGVSTLGARNKLLKSFAYVKENLHD